MPTRSSSSNFSEIRRASPCIKGCPNRWFKYTPLKLKSERNKDGSNSFEWFYTCIPFSYFSRGFYKANDTIVIALTTPSCLFYDGGCHQDRNQALARGSTPSFLRGLGNHTKHNPLTGITNWLSSKSLGPCSWLCIYVCQCCRLRVAISRHWLSIVNIV